MHDLRDIPRMHHAENMTVQLWDWVPTPDSFDMRLAMVRKRMAWNAKEAALACGIKAQSWREWEMHGKRPRDYEGVCKRIAARTGVDYVWLMTGQDRRFGGGSKPSEGRAGSILTPEYESNKSRLTWRRSGHGLRSKTYLTRNNHSIKIT